MLGATLLIAGLRGLAGLSEMPTVEIAPGVLMPTLNHGDGNHSIWLEIGGRGLSAIYSEDLKKAMGQAVKASGLPRADLFVQSGVPCCPGLHLGPDDKCKGLRTFDRTDENINETLDHIGIGPVDLLIMHWPCDSPQDTLAAWRVMEAAVAKGQARAIGVSNFNDTLLADLIKEAQIKPALTQNGYSVGNHRDPVRGSDDATLKYCSMNGVTFEAYSPLGTDTGHSVFDNPVAKAIAESHNKSVAQIALRWDVQQGMVAVTSGSNRDHLVEDIAIFDFKLTEDEMKRLEAAAIQEKTIIA